MCVVKEGGLPLTARPPRVLSVPASSPHSMPRRHTGAAQIERNPCKRAPDPVRAWEGVQRVLHAGDDPGGYALSVNIARRHLSKGQRAMIAAKARMLETSTRLAQRDAAAQADVSRRRLFQAETVLQIAPDLADAVIAGGESAFSILY
jgi:hypothetical protein